MIGCLSVRYFIIHQSSFIIRNAKGQTKFEMLGEYNILSILSIMSIRLAGDPSPLWTGKMPVLRSVRPVSSNAKSIRVAAYFEGPSRI